MKEMDMKATIDRIEGSTAVLISCDDISVRMTMPAAVLPAGSREGDVLTVTLERDDEATTAARAETLSLIERLKQR
jgi:hypothetical protein